MIVDRDPFDARVESSRQLLGESRVRTEPHCVERVDVREAVAQEQNFGHYVETSAKTGQNVQELFQTLTKHFYLNHENNLDRFVSIPQLFVASPL